MILIFQIIEIQLYSSSNNDNGKFSFMIKCHAKNEGISQVFSLSQVGRNVKEFTK